MRLLPISRREKNGIERWKVIKSDLDYAISNHGRIIRLTNGQWPNNAKRGTLLKPAIGSHGYYAVNLGRKSPAKTIHNLVAQAFIGAKPNKNYVCNHKDGNKLNNNPSNLEWVTKSQDIQHAYDTGLRCIKTITYKNITLSIKQWAKNIGIPPGMLKNRLYKGWTIERAVTTKRRVNQYC